MICLCELSFIDGTHVPFNAGLLATIRVAYPKQALYFFGAAAHIGELKQQVGARLADSITWREISPPAPGTPYLKRFVRELSVVRGLVSALPDDPGSRLVLTSAYPSTVVALKVACRFQSRNIWSQIVLHGLSGVVGRRHRHPIRRFQDMKTSLMLWRSHRIQYIVLEDVVRETIVKNLPSLADEIEVFHHPISPNEGEAASNHFDEPIRFGFLGLAMKSKGFPLFVELANELGRQYGRRVEFHAIGRFPETEAAVNGLDALATQPERNRSLSRTEFIRSMMPLHYICLLHEAASYSVTASGVLLDAIAWEKPVVARNIPIFQAMFKQYGDIGYLFDDEAGVRAVVEQIIHGRDRSRYRRQVLNLRGARWSRTPESLAVTYRDICMNREGVAG